MFHTIFLNTDRLNILYYDKYHNCKNCNYPKRTNSQRNDHSTLTDHGGKRYLLICYIMLIVVCRLWYLLICYISIWLCLRCLDSILRIILSVRHYCVCGICSICSSVICRSCCNGCPGCICSSCGCLPQYCHLLHFRRQPCWMQPLNIQN